ncbi:MAG: heparinase II/III family protein, partial [Phycisphaerae bacterium]
IPGYGPTLIDRRPLPEKVEFPSARSKIWPDFGLAVLRAEESPAYWTSDAPVVFALMTKGYGHDHADKFSITFHGAGRLLYPDYNAIQYENANIGWTRNTIAHNTLMVDEADTRSRPCDVRHDFTPEVKYLATSASGVFEKVDQTRALLLTREYLLDVFHAASPTPRVHDYLLHSFGMPRPAQPDLFKPSDALDRRFWLVSDRRAMTTGRSWSLDFVIKEKPGRRKGKFGPEWYDHTAAVRVTMAGEPKTLVTHGVSGIELGKQVKRTFDPLGMLIARRAGVRRTVFVAAHEPYANAAKPQIMEATKLAQSERAILVRVKAADYTDYAAVSFGPQPDKPQHVLAAADDPKTRVAFRDYGYLRVRKDGTAVARGGWTGLRLPAAKAALTLNGRPARATVGGGYLIFGALTEAQAAHVEMECPFPATPNTAVARLRRGGRRAMTFTVKNTLQQSISGALAFELPVGVTVEPAAPRFGPLAPGATAHVPVTLTAKKGAPQGKQLIPYRVSYRTEKAAQGIRTAALPFHLVVGAVLEYVYRHPKRNVFRVSAPRYIAEMDMDSGLTRYLADDDGAVRLEGSPLFTFSDGKKPWLFDGCTNNYTWPSRDPAALTGAPSAYGTCRYRMSFKPDRITTRMDSGWTRFDPTHFTVPGRWTSPQGAPTWARVIAVDASGK